jgi:S-adenosylmethionine:tRNA ribosyltransferase-isomerase
MSLTTALFDYTLPPELVAQNPAERRDKSRLLVVERAARRVSHRVFSDLPTLLDAGDTLFRNNASVLPARLRARRPGGGAVECLLLAPCERGNGAETWRCLVKPGRKLPAGATFADSGGAFEGAIEAWEGDGVARVSFATRGGVPIADIANRIGSVPLPPYIRREGNASREFDRERYQTVYADPARQVAVAAPTAGLHFTPGLLSELASKGVGTADLTLHVGLGTFRPISSETLEGHAMHREVYELPVAAQRALFPSGAGSSRRRVAVGTTAVRSIEDFLSGHTAPLERPHAAEAGLFIFPPYGFRGVDALITNFHQPRSTLLCLVSAFLAPGSTDGIAWLKEIYAEAIAFRYRFFSYGDAMLIL